VLGRPSGLAAVGWGCSGRRSSWPRCGCWPGGCPVTAGAMGSCWGGGRVRLRRRGARRRCLHRRGHRGWPVAAQLGAAGPGRAPGPADPAQPLAPGHHTGASGDPDRAPTGHRRKETGMIWPRIASRREPRGSARPRLQALVALAAALVLAGCTATAASSSAPTSGLDVKPSAEALQQQFVQVVKQVGPSVVLIQTSEGLGSGIVFDAKGDVVTNHQWSTTPTPSRSPWPTADSTGPAWWAASPPTTWRCCTSTPAGCSRLPSPTLPASRWATWPWLSATRWGCSRASPKGSSAPSAAPSTRTTGSPCPT
jgi:hypothetical protein